MTVAELIEKLKEFDQDCIVTASTQDGGSYIVTDIDEFISSSHEHDKMIRGVELS